MYKHNMRRARVTIKAVIISYSECVSLALVIQHAKSLRPIILSHVVFLGILHSFPNYLINGTIFDIKWLNVKCVF